MNIIFRERVFNFTASVVGNVTINRTGMFRLLHVCFCHVDQGKDLLSQRYRTFISHDLSSFGCFVALGTYIWVLTGLLFCE